MPLRCPCRRGKTATMMKLMTGVGVHAGRNHDGCRWRPPSMSTGATWGRSILDDNVPVCGESQNADSVEMGAQSLDPTVDEDSGTDDREVRLRIESDGEDGGGQVGNDETQSGRGDDTILYEEATDGGGSTSSDNEDKTDTTCEVPCKTTPPIVGTHKMAEQGDNGHAGKGVRRRISRKQPPRPPEWSTPKASGNNRIVRRRIKPLKCGRGMMELTRGPQMKRRNSNSMMPSTRPSRGKERYPLRCRE